MFHSKLLAINSVTVFDRNLMLQLHTHMLIGHHLLRVMKSPMGKKDAATYDLNTR